MAYFMSLKHWPEAEQPRQKFILKGPQALSDAELLAIFLRTGIKGKTAVDLARNLIERFGSLRQLLSASEEDFCASPGLGQAKFIQLQAVLEMAKRHLRESLVKVQGFSGVDETKDYLMTSLRDLPHEAFHSLFLDNKNQLIKSETLSTGTLNRASIFPREVVKSCLKHNAAAVIFAHNHPSGHAQPSQADIEITECLQSALEWVEVQVLDHFVIGETAFSFAEEGLL